MRLDELSCDELRQEVSSALLGPHGRESPGISRVSWLRSLVEAAANRSVQDAIDRVEEDPDNRDPEAVSEMVSECHDLLNALETLIRRKPERMTQVTPVAADARDELDEIPF